MAIKMKRLLIPALACIVAVVIAIVIVKTRGNRADSVIARQITPTRGSIAASITTTGTVYPLNRLELKPAVNGRIDRVLVSEGQKVRVGQILAWMSSTERAALIDAARINGAGAVRYWEEAYRPIPIVAPINGTVIVRSVEPGQTVTTAGAVLVLSDRLIVRADVDETDIGRVREGQKAEIRLDAYPETRVQGRVGLISYESKIVNNVTMYEVNVIPESVPAIYRSGMSAEITIIEKMKDDALILPSEAVVSEGVKRYVWVVPGPKKKPVKREVTVGIADESGVEIVSGIGARDVVAVMAPASISFDAPKGGSPFMPAPKKQR